MVLLSRAVKFWFWFCQGLSGNSVDTYRTKSGNREVTENEMVSFRIQGNSLNEAKTFKIGLFNAKSNLFISFTTRSKVRFRSNEAKTVSDKLSNLSRVI